MTRAAILAIAVVGSIGLAAASARQLPPHPRERVIHVTAKRFEYVPSEITVRRNEPVVLEITSLDREHGFKLRALGVRADLRPGKVTRVRIVPSAAGRFPFECDVFCGSGHEEMSGELIVVE